MKSDIVDIEPPDIDLEDNEKLVEIFKLLEKYYIISRDSYRAKTFANVANIINSYGLEITSGAQAQKIHGIGKSTSEIIDEFLKTGKVQRLIDLENKLAKQKQLIDYFSSFYGIGPVKAADLVSKGYTTLGSLWRDKEKLLTPAQQAGVLWRYHIPVRIQREEIDIIYDIIASIFNPRGLKWEITGSYRREESSSGDIDILIEKDGTITTDEIVLLLKPYLPTIFSKGFKKIAGMFRLSEEYYAHRLDVLLIPAESWPYALLHFTGSGKFNVLMRNRAKMFKWKLSEYSLMTEHKTNIPVENEEDIFNILKVKYLKPYERTKDLNSLTFY